MSECITTFHKMNKNNTNDVLNYLKDHLVEIIEYIIHDKSLDISSSEDISEIFTIERSRNPSLPHTASASASTSSATSLNNNSFVQPDFYKPTNPININFNYSDSSCSSSSSCNSPYTLAVRFNADNTIDYFDIQYIFDLLNDNDELYINLFKKLPKEDSERLLRYVYVYHFNENAFTYYIDQYGIHDLLKVINRFIIISSRYVLDMNKYLNYLNDNLNDLNNYKDYEFIRSFILEMKTSFQYYL